MFIDICRPQDAPNDHELCVVARTRNVQHNGSVVGIMRGLNVGDRWLDLSDWDQDLLKWEDE